MTLEARLAEVRAAAAQRIPPERRAIMHAATDRLRRSGILDRVIKPGTQAPHFALKDQSGETVALAGLLASGPVLLSVFRGFW
jgi:hypothetical protein